MVQKFLILIMLTSCTYKSAANPIKENTWERIANIPLTINSQSTSLKAFKGKQGLYLKFWASWCHACMEEMPSLKAHFKTYEGQLKILALNINLEETPALINAVKKHHSLTMPIGIDDDGLISEAINFPGTPYHVVFAPNGQLLHQGFGLTQELDRAITQAIKLTPETPLPVHNSKNKEAISEVEPRQTTELLYFTNIWCDWYLEQTRPNLAMHCTKATQNMVKLKNEYPNIPIRGVISYLWASPDEFKAYKLKYRINFNAEIDKQHLLHLKYGIKGFKELLIIHNGEVTRRLTVDKDYAALKNSLKDNLVDF